MKKTDNISPDEFRQFLKSIPPEYAEKKNKEQFLANEKMYEEFKHAYSKGCCSLCGNKLDYFYPSEFCFHWFLRPTGIKKKDFNDYLSEPIGHFKLESYFRWMATLDKFLKNINDIKSEMSNSKLKEVTIKYKNIEWALNYGKSDLEGHEGSQNANFPHFHLQMLIDGQPFIRFNDFHIPFSKSDLFDIRLMKEANDLIDFQHSQGPGMSVLEDPELLTELDKISTVSESMETALFQNHTMVSMPDGKTMSGDKIAEIVEESKITKVPIRQLMQKYFPEATIVTEVEPAEGMPEMKKRN